ncbi:MAG: glycosyltransferase family 2 protein [Burkholderiales bacterium]|nr:glycosyltransferase family 2 protein [Burkholderiales bacterium]
MKVVVVSMIRNEGDIVEAFVRHHALLADHLIVLDHASTDGTAKVLQLLVSEGLPLTVRRDDSLTFQQGPRTTALAREAFIECGADYVLPIDADEMLRVDSRDALEAALRAIPPGYSGHLAWQNYVVTTNDDPAVVNPVARMQFRASSEPMPERKVVLTRQMLGDDRWQVAAGNHSLVMETPQGTRTTPMHALNGAMLAHYPLRSQEQVHQKIILGWLSTRLQDPAGLASAKQLVSSNEFSWHWQHLFADTLRDPTLSREQLLEYAMRLYVHKRADMIATDFVPLVEDPIAVNYALRYTSASTSIALTSLAQWTDRLLTRLSAMPNA